MTRSDPVQLGMVRLKRMGASIARRLMRRAHDERKA